MLSVKQLQTHTHKHTVREESKGPDTPVGIKPESKNEAIIKKVRDFIPPWIFLQTGDSGIGREDKTLALHALTREITRATDGNYFPKVLGLKLRMTFADGCFNEVCISPSLACALVFWYILLELTVVITEKKNWGQTQRGTERWVKVICTMEIRLGFVILGRDEMSGAEVSERC